MGQTFPFVLWFLLPSTLLYCGHAQDAVLTLEPNWSTFFTGESVTFLCDMGEGKDTDWTYNIKKNGQDFIQHNTHKRYTLQPLSKAHSGEYQCFGHHLRSYHTKNSNIVSLTVSEDKPWATLIPGPTTIPAGGSVTLTCSVEGPAGWKFSWYSFASGSYPFKVTVDPDRVIRISQGGKYRCIGSRGKTTFHTHPSAEVNIKITFSNVVSLTTQPNWPQIFRGETITLICEIQGGDTEWEYEWKTTSSYKPPNQNEFRIDSASSSHLGNYECRGRIKSAQQSSTEWSNSFSLTVSDKPKPVLTVSPLWPSPGASVTLSCRVEVPSAGWRFYWYKAVPNQSKYSYSYELLPGNTNGTEQDSYIVHGPTHTAGYVCRAGRGDPVYYTQYSEPKFVWSGDFHQSASLTVSPDRVQHFNYDSVSLSCEGNSTEWRVMRFSESGYLSHCSSWGRMTGSTCKMDYWSSNAVHWCESRSGEFSNAVNITVNYDIILLSPVRPVAEGESVTLGCKLRPEDVLTNVFFYKNNKLIQNDTRRELTIPAVSKSHEGFYKCERKDSLQARRTWTSPESWMSVKSASRPKISSLPVPLIVVGLVCGILLIILLLLLLFCCRKSKDSGFIRSQSTNQSSATDDMINQAETQCNKSTSHLHGDVCLYESIKGPEDTETDESRDVTYTFIDLKNFAKLGKNNKEESRVNSDVSIGSAADDTLMYAQIYSHNKESTPAAADETVYSEVKPGRARDLKRYQQNQWNG